MLYPQLPTNVLFIAVKFLKTTDTFRKKISNDLLRKKVKTAYGEEKYRKTDEVK